MDLNYACIIVSALGSFALGSVITELSSRKKTKAQTELFNTEMYSTMLSDLRAQITMLVSQIDSIDFKISKPEAAQKTLKFQQSIYASNK